MAKINCYYFLLPLNLLSLSSFLLSAGKGNRSQINDTQLVCWYTKDNNSIHLCSKATSRSVVPHCWGIGGRRWRRREILGSLSWESVEQPALMARVLLFEGKSLFIWIKNEIMFFIIDNQIRYHTYLNYLQVLRTYPSHVPAAVPSIIVGWRNPSQPLPSQSDEECVQ